MFASQQELCSRKFVLHGQTIDRDWNIEEMKHLNEKMTRQAVSSRLADSGQVVIHAVTQCAYTCQHKQS